MESCLKAAFQYEDDDKKLKLVKKACDSGNKLDCLTTTWHNDAKDPKKGIEYLEKRCDAGESTDCGLLGTMYSDREVVKKDILKSAIYHDKACNLGEGLSCAMLAERYSKGDGVKMDATKAAVYYKKGCDLVGELLGCYNFAIFNHYVEKDKNKAAKYYKKACDSGKDSPFINLSPEFKETWQKSCDMYEILK